MGCDWRGVGFIAAGVVVVVLAQFVWFRFYSIKSQYGPVASIVGVFVDSSLTAIAMTSVIVDSAVRLVVRVILAVSFLPLEVRPRFVNGQTPVLIREALPGVVRRRHTVLLGRPRTSD